jgi:hypothetical protein
MLDRLGDIIGPAFIALLAISAIAVALFLISLFKGRIGRQAVGDRIELLTKVAAAITAVIGLLVAIAGVATPLRIFPKDDAMVALSDYYGYLQSNHPERAFAILSNARIEERRKDTPGWGYANFAALFEGTRGYDNRTIKFSHEDGGDRYYKVTFDVWDDVARNKLFNDRKNSLSSFAGILNLDNVNNTIIDNLKDHYIVPGDPASVSKIRDYISNRSFRDLMDPLFISIMVSDLKRFGVSLERKPIRPNIDRVKRHFIYEDIEMIKEDGSWKIRRFPDVIIANY